LSASAAQEASYACKHTAAGNRSSDRTSDAFRLYRSKSFLGTEGTGRLFREYEPAPRGGT
jgi:hypothetical protein